MLIDDFGALANVKRYGSGYAANGVSVKGQATTMQIYAVIEPLRPREIMILPEGERTREYVRVYTETQLVTADESAQTMGDRVDYNGREYEVQQCEIWNDGEDTFYKAIAVLVEKDTGGKPMEPIVPNVFQVVVGKTSVKILDVNQARKFLQIENKDDEKAAVVKVGVDFLTPTNEAQKIEFSAVPTAGTWQIILNSTPTNITPELAYNANAATIQAAIRNQSTGSGCTVSGNYSDGFAVSWAGDQANSHQPLLQIVNNGLLTNANHVYEIQTITFPAVPDAGAFKLSLGGLETAELDYAADATAVQSAVDAAGWPTVVVTGDFSTGFVFTFGVYGAQSLIVFTENTLTNSDDIQDDLQTIYSAGPVSEGTFKLQFDGQTTAAIDVTERSLASVIEAALEALSNVGTGNVSVSGSDMQGGFEIDFTGLSGPQPLLTVWDNQVTYNAGELDVVLKVQHTQEGIDVAACTGTVTHTRAGHDTDAVTATVTETTIGVPDNHEGFPIPAGADPGNPLNFDVSVPISAIYAMAEDDGVVLEVREG